MSPLQVRYVAAAAIVLIGAINYIGVQRAATVMTFATVGKYVAGHGVGRTRVYCQYRRGLSLHAGLGLRVCTCRC